MKKIFALLIIALPYFSNAQKSSGEIKFQETIKLDIDLPEGNEELKKNIPASQSLSKTLLFNTDESYYKDDAPNEDLEINQANDGNQVQIVMKNPENNIYTSSSKNLLIQSTEFFGKYFLITGDLKSKKWKLTGEQKQILDYPCQKAMLIDTSQNVVAWFTSQIPVHIGPNGYANLPGTVLLVEIDNGARTIAATNVNLRSLKDNEIAQPTKGKKVSAQEFSKIRDEKMKEMGMINGKGGGMKMIIREERH
jgi:GLPGLI family protein